MAGARMTILDRLIHEVEAARGPITSKEIARRIGVSGSTLDGMVSVLVATGRLAGNAGPGTEPIACSGVACGTSCVGIDDCAFIVAVPQSHQLVIGSVSD